MTFKGCDPLENYRLRLQGIIKTGENMAKSQHLSVCVILITDKSTHSDTFLCCNSLSVSFNNISYFKISAITNLTAWLHGWVDAVFFHPSSFYFASIFASCTLVQWAISLFNSTHSKTLSVPGKDFCFSWFAVAHFALKCGNILHLDFSSR